MESLGRPFLPAHPGNFTNGNHYAFSAPSGQPFLPAHSGNFDGTEEVIRLAKVTPQRRRFPVVPVVGSPDSEQNHLNPKLLRHAHIKNTRRGVSRGYSSHLIIHLLA